MQAYKREVVVGRVGGLHMSAEERGLYRLRSASDTPYSGAYVYGRRDKKRHKVLGFLAGCLRLVTATMVLLAWVASVYLYRDTPVSLLADGSPWLTLSHLLVPLGFFCVALTNRRYGPAYAFAQVVLTAIAIVAVILFAGEAINTILPPQSIPPTREAAAFGAAFFGASFVSIVAFDGARGPYWWSAPLVGFLSAGIVFALIFYAVGQVGSDALWLDHGFEYMGVLAGAGVLLLVPFYALRRMVPPVSGFGGY